MADCRRKYRTASDDLSRRILDMNSETTTITGTSEERQFAMTDPSVTHASGTPVEVARCTVVGRQLRTVGDALNESRFSTPQDIGRELRAIGDQLYVDSFISALRSTTAAVFGAAAIALMLLRPFYQAD